MPSRHESDDGIIRVLMVKYQGAQCSFFVASRVRHDFIHSMPRNHRNALESVSAVYGDVSVGRFEPFDGDGKGRRGRRRGRVRAKGCWVGRRGSGPFRQ